MSQKLYKISSLVSYDIYFYAQNDIRGAIPDATRYAFQYVNPLSMYGVLITLQIRYHDKLIINSRIPLSIRLNLYIRIPPGECSNTVAINTDLTANACNTTYEMCMLPYLSVADQHTGSLHANVFYVHGISYTQSIIDGCMWDDH